MRHLLLSWIVLGMGLMSCSVGKQDKDFAFCLLENDIKAEDIQKIELSKVVLHKPPVFTINDITAYSRSKHSLKLTKEAYKRFYAIEIGKPFAICLGETPVYLGVVWSQLYSSSFDGIVAISSLEKDSTTVQVLAGYPNESYFKGVDPRPNQAILSSIAKYNKLVE